jgi:hypothetical protein
MAPVYPPADSGDGADKHDAAPALVLHPRDAVLGEQEAGTQVDVERIVKLVERDVGDLGDALAIARVGDEDVGAAGRPLGRPAVVLPFEVPKQLFDVRHRSRIHHVNRDLPVATALLSEQLLGERVHSLAVAKARERQRGALGPESTSTCCPDAVGLCRVSRAFFKLSNNCDCYLFPLSSPLGLQAVRKGGSRAWGWDGEVQSNWPNLPSRGTGNKGKAPLDLVVYRRHGRAIFGPGSIKTRNDECPLGRKMLLSRDAGKAVRSFTLTPAARDRLHYGIDTGECD